MSLTFFYGLRLHSWRLLPSAALEIWSLLSKLAAWGDYIISFYGFYHQTVSVFSWDGKTSSWEKRTASSYWKDRETTDQWSGGQRQISWRGPCWSHETSRSDGELRCFLNLKENLFTSKETKTIKPNRSPGFIYTDRPDFHQNQQNPPSCHEFARFLLMNADQSSSSMWSWLNADLCLLPIRLYLPVRSACLFGGLW